MVSNLSLKRATATNFNDNVFTKNCYNGELCMVVSPVEQHVEKLSKFNLATGDGNDHDLAGKCVNENSAVKFQFLNLKLLIVRRGHHKGQCVVERPRSLAIVQAAAALQM